MGAVHTSRATRLHLETLGRRPPHTTMAESAPAAPTFSALGTPSFCSRAKIKILLTPAAPVERAEFERWSSFVRSLDTIRLRDIPRSSSSVHERTPLHKQGEVHLSFVTAYDLSQAFLAPFDLHHQVLGVLGLTTFVHGESFAHDLERVPGMLRDQHPGAVSHRVFAFDVAAREPSTPDVGGNVPIDRADSALDDGDLASSAMSEERDVGDEFRPPPGFAGRREGGLVVFPAVRKDNKDVRFYLRTLLAEFVGGLLDNLDALVTGLDGTPLETPRETLEGIAGAAPPQTPIAGGESTGSAAGMSGAASRASALFRSLGGGQSGASSPAQPGSPAPGAAPPLPPRQNSMPPAASSSGGPAGPSHPSVASKVFGSRIGARRPRSSQSASGTPISGPTGTTRIIKVRADTALLSGDLWLALELYDSILTPTSRDRALAGGQDAVWLASALEGWAVARMLLARMGGAAMEQAPKLAYPLAGFSSASVRDREKDREVHEPAVPQFAHRDIAEAYSLALSMYAKCLAPPHLLLEPVRSVTNETPRDFTHPYIYASGCLSYARFLLALWASGGWNGECFDQLLYGGTPPALAGERLGYAEYAQLSAFSGVYRHEVATAASQALTQSLRATSPTSQIDVLASVASILGEIGFRRQQAEAVCQLQSVTGALLARSFATRQQLLPPSLPLEALLNNASRFAPAMRAADLGSQLTARGTHTTSNPAVVLGLQACDTLGVNLLVSPLRNVPSMHVLEVARQRLCAERYGSLSQRFIGTRNVPPSVDALAEQARRRRYGSSALQILLLKELVALSEALEDHVCMAFFGALLLRDYASELAPTDQTRVLTGMRRVLPLARLNGAPELQLAYWAPADLLAALELHPLPSAAVPEARNPATFDPPAPPAGDAPEPPAGVNNPFFWNVPRASQQPDYATLVQDERITVDVTLSNPLNVELTLPRITLLTSGAAFDAEPAYALVPPRSHLVVRLHGVPRAPGSLSIEGCTVTLWGCAPHELRLGVPERVACRPRETDSNGNLTLFSKATGLDARPSVHLMHMLKVLTADASTGEPSGPGDRATCVVHAAQPRLELRFPTLAYTSLSLLQGESTQLQVQLDNPSPLPVDFVRFVLSDSLQAPMRSAIVDAGLLAGDVHEIEWQLLYAPVLALPHATQAAIRIEPHSSCTVPLQVSGRPGCRWASVQVYYGYVRRSEGMEHMPARVQLRSVQRTIPITVLPSVTHGALELRAMNNVAATALAAQLTDTPLQRPLDSAFLVSIDVHNPSNSTLVVDLEAEATKDLAVRAAREIPAGSSTRVAMPIARVPLEPGALEQPIPRLSPRQFVVSQTPLAPQVHAAHVAEFWLRDTLLGRLCARWREPHSGRHGDLSLRDVWLPMHNVGLVYEQLVSLRLSLASAAPVAAEDAFVIQAHVQNNSGTCGRLLTRTDSLQTAPCRSSFVLPPKAAVMAPLCRRFWSPTAAGARGSARARCRARAEKHRWPSRSAPSPRVVWRSVPPWRWWRKRRKARHASCAARCSTCRFAQPPPQCPASATRP